MSKEGWEDLKLIVAINLTEKAKKIRAWRQKVRHARDREGERECVT